MPTNNLPFLNSDPERRTGVQATTLGLDALSRFVCNTLDEALAPDREGTPPFDLTADFDAIVIGSGMYGGYCAQQLWRNGAKVLVLEAGPFLISEHYQNLSNVGLGTGGTIFAGAGAPGLDDVTDQVWGMPWRSNQIFARQAFCAGGKSVFWGGWAPRLTDDVLAGPFNGGAAWPSDAADYLKDYYERMELQLGVRERTVGSAGAAPVSEVRTDLFNDPAQNVLTQKLEAKLKTLVGNIPATIRGNQQVQTTIEAIQPAPIAVQASAPLSGLFSFDKFSSMPLLAEAIREDFGRSKGLDQRRRLFLVPKTRVLRMQTNAPGDRVTALEVFDGSRRRDIGVAEGCQVVLALSAIESTRLAQDSFNHIAPLNALMGRNLMAHLRNNFSVRVRRSALGIADSAVLQTSSFHVAGKASNGLRYHFQFYAGYQFGGGTQAEAVLYRMIADADAVDQLLANQDPDWVSITFRGCAEMAGRTDLPAGDSGASYVNLSNEVDPLFGNRRAWVHLVQQQADLDCFDEMDQAMFSLARRLVSLDADIQYFDMQEGVFRGVNSYAPGGDRYGKLVQERGVRDALGTTYHDSGTLWMGSDASRSVTDAEARFHQVHNCYVADQAAFARGGSANPVPTGMLIARRVSEAIANGGLAVVKERNAEGRIIAHSHEAEPGFEPLFVFDRDARLPRNWRHVGSGSFSRFGLSLETADGIGLLVYEKEEFTDFTLRLQWKAPTIRNNAGVYVRLPKANLGDVGKAIKTGYEIQIDNTGERDYAGDAASFPFPRELFNAFHQTGSIYPVHARNADGSFFPAEGQLPSPNGAASVASIPTRALNGWNDFEILVAGNRIKVMLNGVAVLANGTYQDARSAYPKGLIALQNHFKGFRVQFRHVRVKRGTPVF